MLEAGKTYSGIRISGAALTTSQGGTVGLRLTLHTEDDQIDHVIWFPKTGADAEKKAAARDRLTKTLTILGVTPEALKSAAFWRDPSEINGDVNFSFTTTSDMYGVRPGGTPRVKVEWINEARGQRTSSASPAAQVAMLFGATAEEVEADDEVPF